MIISWKQESPKNDGGAGRSDDRSEQPQNNLLTDNLRKD